MSREDVIAELISVLRADSRSTEAFDEMECELLQINRSDARALDVLEEYGQLTAGELATATKLTSGAVTAVIDRLEKAGYARRVRDPSDRRKVLVESTEKARTAAWEIYGPLAEQTGPMLAGYSDDDLGLITAFHRAGIEMRDERAGQLRELLQRRRSLPEVDG
jgi:DNA-binding MarR family transcriptional regulator